VTNWRGSTITYAGVDFDVALHQFWFDLVGKFGGNAIEDLCVFVAQGQGLVID
jgi:hypothetical protein